MNYLLTYEQPYEYDDDDSSAGGGHEIGYSRTTAEFAAPSDLVAKELAQTHLLEGTVKLSLLHGGDVGKRRFVSLTCTREVRMTN